MHRCCRGSEVLWCQRARGKVDTGKEGHWRKVISCLPWSHRFVGLTLKHKVHSYFMVGKTWGKLLKSLFSLRACVSVSVWGCVIFSRPSFAFRPVSLQCSGVWTWGLYSIHGDLYFWNLLWVLNLTCRKLCEDPAWNFSEISLDGMYCLPIRDFYPRGEQPNNGTGWLSPHNQCPAGGACGTHF